jgi:hypothetical protein
VTAPAASNGRASRSGDLPGDVVSPRVFVAISASSSIAIGPFQTITNHLIESLAGTLSYAVAPPVPLVFVSGTPTDVVEMYGSGAPVDAVTGRGMAGIGSKYTDIAAGKFYINSAAKTSPAWKIVTSA